MSVIIKGMAMPETCYECRFCEEQSEYPFNQYCVAHLNYIENARSSRLDTCPLEEVQEPKHGKWYEWSFTAFDGCTVWHRACSVCGYKRDDDNLDKDTNYCPNCGAKMVRSEE